MSDLGELYQQLILDHNAAPRNYGQVDQPTHQSDGHNPLCGDQLHVTLEVRAGVIRQVKFEGSGCAISRASSSLMTLALTGKTLDEAQALFDQFHRLVTGESDADPARLGKLAAFAGVRQFPSRVKCASLPWHTLRAALAGQARGASTE